MSLSPCNLSNKQTNNEEARPYGVTKQTSILDVEVVIGRIEIGSLLSLNYSVDYKKRGFIFQMNGVPCSEKEIRYTSSYNSGYAKFITNQARDCQKSCS